MRATAASAWRPRLVLTQSWCPAHLGAGFGLLESMLETKCTTSGVLRKAVFLIAQPRATLNATNLTGAADHDPHSRPYLSPVLALLICGVVLLFVWPSFVRLLQHTHAHLPLRRHLGGRGHYVALAREAEP